MDEVCAMAPGTSVMTKGYLSAEESGLRTRVRFVKAGKYLDERRFARPILAQEAVDLILIDGDRYVVKGNLAGEGLADVRDGQQGRLNLSRRFRRLGVSDKDLGGRYHRDERHIRAATYRSYLTPQRVLYCCCKVSGIGQVVLEDGSKLRLSLVRKMVGRIDEMRETSCPFHTLAITSIAAYARLRCESVMST